MKSFVLYSFLFLLFPNIKSQELLLASELYPELRYHSLKGEVFFFDYRQVKGSPYLLDEWMTGDIYLDDGNTIQNVKLKLDVYAHRILAYQDHLKRVVITEKKHIAEFTLMEDGTEERFKKIVGVNSKSKVYDGCYFKVLTEGIFSLYKLDYKDLLPLQSQSKTFVDEFIDETAYFVARNNEYRQIRLSKAYFILNFPEYKIQMKKFIRKNKLRMKKEKDFVVAVDHLNEISQLLQED